MNKEIEMTKPSMLYPVLIVPQGDFGSNGVFAYVGCAQMVDDMRGFDAGFAYASTLSYGPMEVAAVRELIKTRTPDQTKLVNDFVAIWAQSNA